jgi:hypothetical protein
MTGNVDHAAETIVHACHRNQALHQLGTKTQTISLVSCPQEERHFQDFYSKTKTRA